MEDMTDREFRQFVVRRLFSIESTLLIEQISELERNGPRALPLKQMPIPEEATMPEEAARFRRFFRRVVPKKVRAILRSVFQVRSVSQVR